MKLGGADSLFGPRLAAAAFSSSRSTGSGSVVPAPGVRVSSIAGGAGLLVGLGADRVLNQGDLEVGPTRR